MLRPNERLALHAAKPRKRTHEFSGRTENSVIGRGVFDINPGEGSAGYCENSYDMHLRVRNRASKRVLFVSAEVQLTRVVDGELLAFFEDEMPNPFGTKTASPVPADDVGVVEVQAIPVLYAQQLNWIGGGEITARIVLEGETETGGRITSRPFEYPIELCEGCMTRCLDRDILGKELSVEAFYGEACRDDAAADDRFCIDPDC